MCGRLQDLHKQQHVVSHQRLRTTMTIKMAISRRRMLRALLLLLASVAHPSHGEVFLWPQPRSIAWSSGPPIPLAPSFSFQVPQQSRELRLASRRVRRLILSERWLPVQAARAAGGDEAQAAASRGRYAEALPHVKVTVADLQAELQQGVDESYAIVVPEGGGGGATVQAETVWGAMRALETFSQLVRREEGEQGKLVLVLEHGVKVQDAPLYAYRGVLLDLARNFYPLPHLLRTVRAMAHNKLNVLHLHLTDSQSFPLDLPSEPQLARKGSYGPGFVYSVADIRRLVAYGRSHGVRIVPEIDTPGHSGSWGAAYPEIVTCRDKFWWYPGGPRMAVEPAPGQLNPLSEETYRVVKNVVDDVARAFPEALYHAGGDEMLADCWMDDAQVRSFVSHGGTLGELLHKFVSSTLPFIAAHNKTAIFWEDVLLSSAINISSSALPPSSTILESWRDGPLSTKLLTSAGYRTIVASSDFYYLDCGRGRFLGNDTDVDQMLDPSPGTPSYNYGGNGGSWCAPYKSWQRIYDYDIAFNLTAQ